MPKVCRWQYGPWARAGLGRRNDPYSWYCHLPPSTKVALHIQNVEVWEDGDYRSEGELHFFFAARHLSPKCSGKLYRVGGRSYRTCKEWPHDKRKNSKGRRTVSINYTFPHVNLHDGDAFQIDWYAKEYDPLNVTQKCGTLSGDAVIIPVRKTFTSEDNWGIGPYCHRRAVRCGGSA